MWQPPFGLWNLPVRGVHILARSPSADFALLIASISCLSNGKTGRCARDLSGYKAVSGQSFCSAVSISRESLSRGVLVWKRQTLDSSPCKRNVERIGTLHAQRSDLQAEARLLARRI